MYYVSKQLYHHGILGQRWGKKNGPPYPLNAEDHSQTEKKAGWKNSLDGGSTEAEKKAAKEAVKKPGKYTQRLADIYAKDYEENYGGTYSKKAAQQAGMDKAKIMKRVAIGAGVVVGVGIAAYVAKEYGRNFADDLISSGTTIQTLSVDPDRMDKGLAFYTAFTEADKNSYMSFFGDDRYTGARKDIIQALVKKDIRVAGTNTGQKVFDKLMKTDSDFASTVRRAIRGDWSGMPFVNSDYEKYNILLVRQEYDSAHKKFYDALKELGYGAVADVNDRFNPEIKSHSAIVFDRSDIMRTSVSHLTDEKLIKAMGKDSLRRLWDDTLFTPVSMIIGGASSVAAANSMVDRRNAKKYGRDKISK